MDSKTTAATPGQDDSDLLPDFCNVRIIFMLVLVVELLAIVLAMSIPSTVAAFWDHLAFISMLMQWIALVNAAILCSIHRQLRRLPASLETLFAFSIMMMVSLLFGISTLKLGGWISPGNTSSMLGEYFLPRMLMISAVIYAIVLRFFYIQQQWKLNLGAQARAEIQALKARIRPHFLFNSMNTIASLISFRPDAAEKAVEDLSDLFRASLQEHNIHTLKQELDLTRSYLDIEKLRLGGRLRIEWSIEPDTKNAEIPALSLQPLAENAIYHGIEPLPGGGIISISARCQEQRLMLSVSNPISASGMPHHHGNRMAQQNIRQRLLLAYGDDAGFYINETKQSYTVTLEIPLVS